MPADLDALLTHVYVLVDDLPPTPPSVWSRPSFSSARSNRDRRSSATRALPGGEFEQLVVSLRARILRPDRRNEPARFGSLGGVRRWVESAFDTLKDQLSLERHGVGRSLASSAASHVGCWRSPPRSCTTGRSASPDGASSPTTTKESIV
jgi:hypothetical protein